MSHVWTFEPDETPEPVSVREAYVPIKKGKKPHWVAPEHLKMSSDMGRDYPRNEKGERIEGRERELKLDPRPTIMKPERKTRIGWL
jgi:hypothetical protein